MRTTLHTLRAISAITFRKLFTPVAIIAGIILLVAWAATILLGNYVHGAWFLLLILVVPLTILAIGVAGILWIVSGKLIPRQLNTDERRHIGAFADRLFRVAEVRATPIPLMVFFIAKDIVRGRKSSYIENVIGDTTSLKDDFTAIRTMFE